MGGNRSKSAYYCELGESIHSELKGVILDYFITREDVIAVYPEFTTNLSGNIEHYIDGHLSGEARIGFYNLDAESNVKWAVIDLDNHSKQDDIESRIKLFLDEFGKTSDSIGLPFDIEISKGGDFHIWVFFDEPTNAKIVRTFFRDYVLLIGEKASLPSEWVKNIEVFPKQESLSLTSQIGNMVWLPFYGGVDDIGDGAQNGYTIFIDSQDVIPSLKTMNELDIERISEVLELGMPSNLSKPKSRHNTLTMEGVKLAKNGVQINTIKHTLHSMNKGFEEPKSESEVDKLLEWISENVCTIKDANPLKLMSGLEALNYTLPPKEMIVEEIIGKHKIISIAAKTNVGKSICALQIGIAVALGLDEVLGFKIDRPRRVLFLNFEMDDDELVERIKLQLGGITEFDKNLLNNNFHFNTFEGKRELFTDNWDSIEKTINTSEPFDLIIVDNLYSCTDKNDERNDELKEILSKIISISDIHLSSILLVNHHKKHDDEAILTIDLIRGGSTFANAVDVIIQFSESLKEPGLRLMKITKNRSKSPNKLKCFGLKMDEHLWFHNIGEVKEAWYMQNPKVPSEDEVIIGELPDVFLTREYTEKLVSQTGATERTGFNRLKALERDGIIEKVSQGQYKKRRG